MCSTEYEILPELDMLAISEALKSLEMISVIN